MSLKQKGNIFLHYFTVKLTAIEAKVLLSSREADGITEGKDLKLLKTKHMVTTRCHLEHHPQNVRSWKKTKTEQPSAAYLPFPPQHSLLTGISKCLCATELSLMKPSSNPQLQH